MAYNKPYTFRAGTPAKSAEVNANFDTLKDFVNELLTTFQEKLVAQQAYNKAYINGDASNKFEVADGTTTNDAVNYGQLNTLASRVSTLESKTTWVPPDYGTGEAIRGSGMFSSDGVLYVENWSSNPDIPYLQLILNINTQIKVYSKSTLMIPVKKGTLYDLSNLQYAGNHKFFAS